MLPLLFLSLLGVGVQGSFLPVCASTCVGEAIDASLCSSADTPCICASRTFLPSLHACIELNCEDEEQEDAIARADQFCAAAQPHSGLRARDAEPEAEPEANYGQPPAYGQPKPPAYGHPKPPAYHPKPPSYGHGHEPKPKPPAYGHKKHHKKCKHHKHPYWSRSQKKCVKKCKSGNYLKGKTCYPHKPHHHDKCKHHKNPYWSHVAKKCVKKCQPHHYFYGKACHHHKPTTLKTHTKTPPTYTTKTKHTTPHKPTTTCTTTTHSRYTPTVTPTVY